MLTATDAKALLIPTPHFTLEQIEEMIRSAARSTSATMFPANQIALWHRQHLEARGFEVYEAAGNVVVSW